MRKRSCALLTTALFLFFISNSHAASEDVLDGMANKFKRGVINTFTGVIEIPAQTIKGYNEGFLGDKENKLLGVACGIFEGLWHGAGRTLSGITDIAGFWAANPKDNENVGVPLDAEYAWEEGKSHEAFEPNFTEATIAPSVNKFFRGAGNTLFGFMEFPGQIYKGISQEPASPGLIKGLWYWISREASGISDLATALFPNPEGTAGFAFDEKWPWDNFSD
jgi:putative exosortase-associated protein (TIGR04073 family)